MQSSQVLAVYRNPPTPSHKTASIAGLCSSEAPELYERTFALVLSPEVKTQDIASFANALAANTSSRRRLWSFFTENYEELMTRFKGPSSPVMLLYLPAHYFSFLRALTQATSSSRT